MSAPKLPSAIYVERVLLALEKHPFGSLVVVVLATLATLVMFR